ncbi:MAG: sigma-70 family RNA polymerase sigma factor [Firmicutes bacterium]|nr:sigma-70 family RNA polymerase sigma factor [Bacillota bacterium]
MDEELARLIKENEKLIHKITHLFSNYSSKEDLFQVGCIGLIKAYNNYREGFNTRFSTYAYSYILGEIKKYIREDKGIKISRDITKLNLKIEKAYLVLAQRLMREPSKQELAEYLGIAEYYINEAMCANHVLQSLDEPIASDSKELTLYDTVSRVESMDMDTLIALKRELALLDKSDYQIISEHYLQDKSQSEIAENMGLNQVQISRREQKILSKLKNRLAA